MNALKVQLQTVAPGRVVTRDLADFASRSNDDLKKGVYTLIARSENNYANYPGRAGQLGKLSIFIVGQIKLTENAMPSAVEDAEFNMIEELKALAQSILPEIVSNLQLQSVRNSSQLETPYGWVSSEWII